MKFKEYLNFLVSRRKKNVSSKSQHKTISSTDCHYEICGSEDPNKCLMNDHHSRTEILLARHAQLVNTIVGTRSQENSCPSCRIIQQPEQQNYRNYSNTLATCNNSYDQYQQQTLISSSNKSLPIKTRQRSKIRTNPWIKTNRILEPEYSVYNPTLSSGLIHSESFPQTIFNGNIHSINQSHKILHHSDSGHGFSLSSSRIINSSSPDNTSTDSPLLDKQHFPSDNKRRIKKSIQSRYSHPKKSSTNRSHHSHSSPPRLYNDQFSIKFEEIVENEGLDKQLLPTEKSPFILPLDETDVKLYSPKLKKTNSHTILKHIEEIENEIELIKNLNLNHDEQILSSDVCSKENKRQSIHEQVDQWVDECLTTKKNNSTKLLHTECNHLSNTIKDYVVCVYSNNNHHQISSIPKSQTKTELMTAFYLSSIPITTKRTFSFINQPLQSSKSQTIEKDFKFGHECPF